MVRWAALLLVGLLCTLLSSAAWATGPTPDVGSVVLRINSPVSIGPSDRESLVAVVGSAARIDGFVREGLYVVNGPADISGVVDGDVVIVNGHLDLEPGARVRNVTLIRSDMTRAPGAVITGELSRRTAWGVAPGWLFWLGLTALVIVGGLVFAAAAGRQLAGAVNALLWRPNGAALAGAFVWVGLPVIAIVFLLTVIGIPLGIAILAFLLPALWFLGYLISGTAIGALLLSQRRTIARRQHPYGPAALGLLVLQAIAFLPWIGGVLALGAGLLGAGALIYRAYLPMAPARS